MKRLRLRIVWILDDLMHCKIKPLCDYRDKLELE